MKARRASIQFGSLEIEVFQLPNGEYRFSHLQVAKAIDKRANYVSKFLNGKSPEASEINSSDHLPKTDYIDIESVPGAKFNAVPIRVAIAFWTYWARKGNTLAQAILAAGTEEVLLRRCDAAFNEVKTEEEYQKQTAETLETSRLLYQIMESQMKLSQQVQQLTELQQASRSHPGCRQVLDEEIENAFPQEMSFTAKEYLESKRLGLDHLRTLQKRGAQFIRLGIYGTPNEKKDGQLVYRGSQIIYLDMALKTILDI